MRKMPEVLPLQQTSSTNEYLANLWLTKPDALSPFFTVLANEQTVGRGRLGREWTAPAGTSMLASILVPADPDTASLLPLVAGVAAHTLISNLLPQNDVQLKWPNDVLVGGRKICGILCESLSEEWTVVGIGLNISQTIDQLPPVPSTSIVLEGGPSLDPSLLALAVAVGIQDLLELSPEQLHSEIEQRCSTLGCPVEVLLPSGDRITGTAISLDPRGALLVRDEFGTTTSVQAGDITHLILAEMTTVAPGGNL